MFFRLLILTATTLMPITVNAQQQRTAEEKQLTCETLLNRMDKHVRQITGKDLISDNNNLLKANLWQVAYAHEGCDPQAHSQLLEKRQLNLR